MIHLTLIGEDVGGKHDGQKRCYQTQCPDLTIEQLVGRMEHFILCCAVRPRDDDPTVLFGFKPTHCAVGNTVFALSDDLKARIVSQRKHFAEAMARATREAAE